MLSLHEELAARGTDPFLIETGLITTVTEDVNLQEISADDWNLLKSIKGNPDTPVTSAVEWLRECGLVVIKGSSVSLTPFATSWLSGQSPQ